MSANFDLKEQIRDYWSARAETFDDSFSHQVTRGVELNAWVAFYNRLMGDAEKHVLDLGCGTGEVSKILFAAGHRVTGIDFSDAMLSRAMQKHADKEARGIYLSGDAEATNLPDAQFDAATCRHLVWTLVNPQQALDDWYRVLKPGGHLIIFDGDFFHRSRKDILIRKLIDLIDPSPAGYASSKTVSMQKQNEDIRKHLPYSQGLKFENLKTLVSESGFEHIKRHSYAPIRRAQRRIAGPADWLRTLTGDRFVLHARKPE